MPRSSAGGFGNLLEASHDVVREKADRAAEEARQVGQLGGAEALDLGAQLLEGVLDRAHFDAAAGPDDVHAVLARAHDDERIGAEKGVAAPFLAAANAFEQEGVIAARDFQKGGDGSLEVGGDLLENRDEVESLRRQLFEFVFARLQHLVSSQSRSGSIAAKKKRAAGFACGPFGKSVLR